MPNSIKAHRALVARLKKLLGVSWSVTVRWGSPEELTVGDGALHGMVLMHSEMETAEILLAKGQGADTLVHEFLHILFDSHRDLMGANYDHLHERALNKTAAALCRLMGLDG